LMTGQKALLDELRFSIKFVVIGPLRPIFATTGRNKNE
jgi:hypothetical protein